MNVRVKGRLTFNNARLILQAAEAARRLARVLADWCRPFSGFHLYYPPPPICPLVDEWVTGIGLRREKYETHALRRTKASIIYKQTGNLRVGQILLGHTKIESTVRYLGVDIEDAMAHRGLARGKPPRISALRGLTDIGNG